MTWGDGSSTPARAVDDLRLPLAHFVYVPETVRVLHTPPRHMMDADSIPLRPARSNFSRTQYMAAVSRCIGYIAAGDLFQVNLSQRFSSTLLSTPLEVYKRLEERSPGDFAALLDFGDYALVCNSPELFLRVARPCERAANDRHAADQRDAAARAGDGGAASRQRQGSGRAAHDR